MPIKNYTYKVEKRGNNFYQVWYYGNQKDSNMPDQLIATTSNGQINFQPGFNPSTYLQYLPGVSPSAGMKITYNGQDLTWNNGQLVTGAYDSSGNYVPAKQSAIDSYRSAYDEAKTANQTRYNQALSGYQSLYDDQMAQLKNYGSQRLIDVGKAYDNLGSSMTQNLISRGMMGSTIYPTMQMGVQRQKQAEINRTSQGLLDQKLGYQQQLAGNIYGLMERRQDPYPDMGSYLALMNSYGNFGGN